MDTPTPTKYPEPMQEYIRLIARYCKGEFYLHEYTMKIALSETPHINDNPTDTTQTFATIKMDTVYLWFRITIYPSMIDFWNIKDYREIANSILHEFVHLLLEPIMVLFRWDVPPSQKQIVNDTLERQVCRITNIITDTLPRDWFDPARIAKFFEEAPVPLVERADT